MEKIGFNWVYLLNLLLCLILPVVLVLVIAVGVWLGLRWNGRGRASHNSSAPLDILKERYARGEITQEQFEQMKRDLA